MYVLGGETGMLHNVKTITTTRLQPQARQRAFTPEKCDWEWPGCYYCCALCVVVGYYTYGDAAGVAGVAAEWLRQEATPAVP